MRILISNTKNNHLLAPQYVKELEKLGYDIHSSFFLDVVSRFRSKFLGKVLLKTLPSLVYFISNKILIQDVEKIKPDVIVILKGMEIFPSTLELFKKKNIFLVNYNLDHPFKYISKASGNNNVKKSIPIYDLHITYSTHIRQEMNKAYPNKSVEILPFGYHSYVSNLNIYSKDIKKICFIGYGDYERARVITYLLKNGFQIDLYGEGWSKLFKDSENLSVYPSITGHDYWHTLANYRVQLNLLREHNFNSHNMRTFEVPAAGGIMLTKRTKEHVSFFKEKEEVFYYDTEEEMVIQLNFILNLEDKELKTIRNRAQEASKKHAYNHRAKELLEIIEKYYEV